MNYYVYDRIRQISGQLFILKKNIKQEIIEANKSRATQQIIDMLLLVKEAYYQSYKRSNLDVVIELLELQLERVREATNKEALEKVIDRVTNLFAEDKYRRELQAYNNTVHYRDALTSNGDFFNELMDQIKNERQLNVLAYDVPTEYLLSKGIKNSLINSYGILIKGHSYANVTQNIAYGSGGNSSISNGVFDVLMLTTNSSVIYDPIGFRGDVIPKSEYLNLVQSLTYLRTEGLLCMQMPYTRLDHDFCHYLSRNIGDIRLTRINEILVEITGLKKSEKVFTQNDYHTLRTVYRNFESLPMICEHQYQLPQSIKAISSFRGSRITGDMLSAAKEKSTAFSKIIATSKHVNDLSNHKPLLPFNTGQIGLVLASGCLDGVVNEDEESCHLIKGKVERKTVVKEGKRGGEDSITVYHSVQINALTPSGKLIQIS